MWGTWLVVLLVVFSASTTVNPYYTAALSPAIAALLGMGVALAWEHRARSVARRAVAATVAVTCGYAIWLLPSTGVGVISGLPEAVGVLGVAAVAVLLMPVRVLTRAGAVALAAIALVAVPAAASVSVVAKRFGPFDTPFEGARRVGPRADARAASPSRPRRCSRPLENAGRNQPDLMATQTSAVAAPFIYDSGREVAADRRVHRDDPGAVGRRAAVDDRQGRLPPRDPVADGHRPPAGGGRSGAASRPSAGASAAPGAPRFAVYYCGRAPGF